MDDCQILWPVLGRQHSRNSRMAPKETSGPIPSDVRSRRNERLLLHGWRPSSICKKIRGERCVVHVLGRVGHCELYWARNRAAHIHVIPGTFYCSVYNDCIQVPDSGF